MIQIVHADRSAGIFLGWFEIGTNKDGKFSLPNLPAQKEFWILARMDGLTGKGVATKRTKILTGADGTTSAPVPLVAAPAVMVTGRVVLSDGKPIPPGTRLMLGRCETWDILQYPLAKDGKFTFANAPSDDLTLSIPACGCGGTPCFGTGIGPKWSRNTNGPTDSSAANGSARRTFISGPSGAISAFFCNKMFLFSKVIDRFLLFSIMIFVR